MSALHIVVCRGDQSTDWREGYYPPLSDSQYQTGIVSHQVNPAPGWRLLHTRASEVKRSLEVMVALEGDGLLAYQKASLDHLLPEDAREHLKTLWGSRELALSPHGLMVAHSAADFTYWMGWERLDLRGLVEACGEYPVINPTEKRKVYRYTSKGWLTSRLAAEVYKWSTSV